MDNEGPTSERGFSLIELMVVTLVIGMLIAIAIPSFLGAKARAQERQSQARLRTGVEAALTHWTIAATFSPFDNGCTSTPGSCVLADAAEPSLAWIGNAQPVGDQVAIVVAAGNSLLLVTRASTGEYFCLTQTSGQTDKGRAPVFAAVDSVPECAGGW